MKLRDLIGIGALVGVLGVTGVASAQEIIWKANKKGKTMFKIVSPEGAAATITGEGVYRSGKIPISADVEGDHFYTLRVIWKGKMFEKKFEAQDGQEGVLVIPEAAFDETPEEKKKREEEEKKLEDERREHERNRNRPGDKPKLGLYDAQPMIEADFEKIFTQLKKKATNQERIDRLKKECKKKNHFSVGQMLRVLALSQDDAEKLDMLRAVRGCVPDHANKPKIAKAFKSNDDKDAAVKILDEQE